MCLDQRDWLTLRTSFGIVKNEQKRLFLCWAYISNSRKLAFRKHKILLHQPEFDSDYANKFLKKDINSSLFQGY